MKCSSHSATSASELHLMSGCMSFVAVRKCVILCGEPHSLHLMAEVPSRHISTVKGGATMDHRGVEA